MEKIQFLCFHDYAMHTRIKFCSRKKVFFLENVCLSTKFDFRLKKKQTNF